MAVQFQLKATILLVMIPVAAAFWEDCSEDNIFKLGRIAPQLS
jgi:hypothetical protein